MSLAVQPKSEEVHYRRLARRRGLRLCKSPRRDPLAYDFGLYVLIDMDAPLSEAAERFRLREGMTLDVIARKLS